jgi:hypothetical protein
LEKITEWDLSMVKHTGLQGKQIDFLIMAIGFPDILGVNRNDQY